MGEERIGLEREGERRGFRESCSIGSEVWTFLDRATCHGDRCQSRVTDAARVLTGCSSLALSAAGAPHSSSPLAWRPPTPCGDAGAVAINDGCCAAAGIWGQRTQCFGRASKRTKRMLLLGALVRCRRTDLLQSRRLSATRRCLDVAIRWRLC